MTTEKAIRYWSDKILDYLLEFRDAHPEFRFLPRKNNDKFNRLKSGQWFQGSDYINVSLVPRSGGNHSTKQIGFEVLLGQPDKQICRLMVVYKEEPDKRILAFYDELIQVFTPLGLINWGGNVYEITYGDNIFDGLNTCLTRDLPVIQSLIKKHGLEKELTITEDSMMNKIERILTIRKELSASENRRARLCWNENYWIKPSGVIGKSKNPDSYEHEKGFGHEEWLLDFDKLIEGYHYGFLEPIQKDLQAFIGCTFRIELFTIDSRDNKKYWVGEINNAEVIDGAQNQLILQEYKSRGWYKEMQEQLLVFGISAESLGKSEINMFNIRFRPKDFTPYNFEPFDDIDNTFVKTNRYKLLKIKNDSEEGDDNSGIDIFQSSTPSFSGNGISTRTFEPKIIELPDTHNRIVSGLYKKLVPIYGAGNIACERGSKFDNTRVDIAVLDSKEEIFYEVKSYLSARQCIRVALGQLMEYCFFPNIRRAKKLVIVTQHKPDELITAYMAHLRKTLQISIFYASYDLDEDILGEEV